MATNKRSATPLVPPYAFGASVVGPMHIKHALPCQDAHAYKTLPEGWIVTAVSDGLGSAKRSDLGAATAVEASVETLEALLTNPTRSELRLQDMALSALCAARAALEAKASVLDLQIRDLACTLIVLVGRARYVSVAHIGDGAVVGKRRGELLVLSGPGDSEYFNEVMPLTADEWEGSVRVSNEVDDLDCIAAITDGCQRAALLKSHGRVVPLDRFFVPLFDFAQQLEDTSVGSDELASFLASDKLAMYFDDDKTLVVGVLYRHDSGEDDYGL